MAHVISAQNNKCGTCSCVSSCLYFVLQSLLAVRSVQSYEKLSLLVIFLSFGSFPLVLEQIKECLVLELHELIRVPDFFA